MAKASKSPKAQAGKKAKSGRKSEARRAKVGKKTAAKKKARKKKTTKKAASRKVASKVAAAPIVTALRADLPAAALDPKNGAVNSCVNALMDAARPGWVDDGKMDADYQYNNHSMRAFLSSVKACLQDKHYVLNMNDDAFVTSCVSAAVYQVKLLIYSKTT
jgi:hypothetical protein